MLLLLLLVDSSVGLCFLYCLKFNMAFLALLGRGMTRAAAAATAAAAVTAAIAAAGSRGGSITGCRDNQRV